MQLSLLTGLTLILGFCFVVFNYKLNHMYKKLNPIGNSFSPLLSNIVIRDRIGPIAINHNAMENQNAVLIINATVDPNHKAELQGYLGNVMQIFGQNGGKPVGRFQTTESLQGEDSPQMVAMIEFPSPETISEMVKSSEFQALGEIRERVFSKLNMMICKPL